MLERLINNNGKDRFVLGWDRRGATTKNFLCTTKQTVGSQRVRFSRAF